MINNDEKKILIFVVFHLQKNSDDSCRHVLYVQGRLLASSSACLYSVNHNE